MSEQKYTQALARLGELVQKIGSEETSIDQLLTLVEEAKKQVEICRSMLRSTEENLNEILKEQ
ncbi:MAG: exodeoxyribonuclease VII small subunit [Paludibacteraceae bacterium]|nr:exodeoxyribonuclease VII small subunit [Paludibacteraceae bacterium]